MTDALLESNRPLIAYDSRGIQRDVDLLEQHLHEAFRGRRQTEILYSIKANMFAGLLGWFADRGVGASIASIPEYEAAVSARMSPVHATGPGFTQAQIQHLAQNGVAVDVDNLSQLLALPFGSQVGLRIRVPLNPDNTDRQEGISRFGLEFESMELDQALADFGYVVTRLHGHFRDIGGPNDMVHLSDILAKAARRFPQLESINIGGGMTRLYKNSQIAELAWRDCERALSNVGNHVRLIAEPGAQVTTKHGYIGMNVVSAEFRPDGRQLVVLDTSRWQLVSWSETTVVWPDPSYGAKAVTTDLVGPTCYEKDLWAAKIQLPRLKIGDRVIVRGVGAYVTSMARSMHGLSGPAEILI